MTTPVPNLITYPSWYQGGYPDIEVLMQQLFQPLLGGAQVVSWLPTPDVYAAQLGAGYGYMRVYRTGGRISYDQNRDEPRVQFAALTRFRDESWKMIEFVRQTLECFQRGAIVPGTTTGLLTVGEIVGPQLIPELIQDDRLVPLTFELHTRKPGGVTTENYRAALGL